MLSSRIVLFFSFLTILIAPIFTKSFLIEGVNSPRLLLANIIFVIFFLSSKKIVLCTRSAIPIGILSLYFLYKLLNTTNAYNFAELIYSSQLTFFFISALIVLNTLSYQAILHSLITSVFIGNILTLLYLGIEIIDFGGFQKASPYQLSSFFSYKNVLSAYLLLSSVLGIYLSLSKKRNFQVALFTIVLINLSVIYYLQSRAVLLAAFCMLFLYFIFHVEKPKLKLVIITGSILSLIFISFYIINFLEIAISSLDSMEERIKLWSKSVQLIQEEFWLGVGAGNWQFNFSRFGVNDIYMLHQSKSSFQSPHNEILWIFSEGGFVGLLLIILVILSFILINRKYQFTHKNTTQQQILTAALIGFFPVAFFSFPSERVAILFLYALLITLWIQLNSLKSKKIILYKSIKFTLAILCLASTIVAAYRFKGEYYTKKMIIAQNSNYSKEVLKQAKKASSWFYNTDSRSTPISSYEGWAHDQLGNNSEQLESVRNAFHLAPYDFEILSNLGSALIKNYQLNEAEKILLKSYKINKYHDPTKFNLSVLYYNKRQYWKALQWLKKIPGYELEYPSILNKIINKLSFPQT